MSALHFNADHLADALESVDLFVALPDLSDEEFYKFKNRFESIIDYLRQPAVEGRSVIVTVSKAKGE